MKTILSYFTFFLTGFLLQAQNTINIEMSGFESNKGKANIGLFNEEQTFLREANWKRFSEINNYKATATFTDIPDGIYAVSVYHDENDNENQESLYCCVVDPLKLQLFQMRDLHPQQTPKY